MDPDLASDRYMEFDTAEDDAFLIQRIDSNEIIYCPPKRKYKVFTIDLYVCGPRGMFLRDCLGFSVCVFVCLFFHVSGLLGLGLFQVFVCISCFDRVLGVGVPVGGCGWRLWGLVEVWVSWVWLGEV